MVCNVSTNLAANVSSNDKFTDNCYMLTPNLKKFNSKIDIFLLHIFFETDSSQDYATVVYSNRRAFDTKAFWSF